MKYFVLFLSALVIEICSTFYITFVTERNLAGMIFFAGISPFLGLPFIKYIVEATNWMERIQMAFALSTGYIAGTLVVIYFINA
jgi:hypothetical protein